MAAVTVEDVFKMEFYILRGGGSSPTPLFPNHRYLKRTWAAISFEAFIYSSKWSDLSKKSFNSTLGFISIVSMQDLFFLVFVDGWGREGGPCQSYTLSAPSCDDKTTDTWRGWWLLVNVSHPSLSDTKSSDNAVSEIMA